MRLLADESTDLDRLLLATLSEKAGGERLVETDLDDCLRVFAMVCNHVDELRFELAGFSQSYQIDFDGTQYSLIFTDGACSVYSGKLSLPDVSLRMPMATVLGLLDGAIDAGVAHMNGDIACRGTKDGSVRLQAVFDLFLDEMNV